MVCKVIHNGRLLQGAKVLLGFTAPRSTPIYREEVAERMAAGQSKGQG